MTCVIVVAAKNTKTVVENKPDAIPFNIQTLPPQVRKHLTKWLEGIYKSEESAYYEIKRVVRLLANDKKKQRNEIWICPCEP